MIFDPCPQRRSALSLTRHALLVSTILGAGALVVLPSVGRAETINVTSPIVTSGAAVVGVNATANDNLLITVSAEITSTDNAGIVGVRGFGSIEVQLNANATAVTNGIYAQSFAGEVLVTGSGNITSTGFADTDKAGEGIYAWSSSSAVTVSGSGTTSAAGIGISAKIETGAEYILITRSGAVTSGTSGAADKDGILADNQGSGYVTIWGIGAVTATGAGISATSTTGDIAITTMAGKTVSGGTGGIVTNSTAGGATSIFFNGNVQSASGSAIWARGTSGDIEINGSGAATSSNASNPGGGIAASTTTGTINLSGTGATSGQGGALVNLQITDASATNDIVITRSGAYTVANGPAIYAVNAGTGAVNISYLGTVQATGSWSGSVPENAAIVAKASGGAVNIGGVDGLANSITSDQRGIYASTTGSGTINVKTKSGGTVTGKAGEGIITSAETGATAISLGAAVTGKTRGISATSSTGAVAITSASGVSVSGTDDDGIHVETSGGAIDIGGTNGLGGNVTGITGIYANSSGGRIDVATASTSAVTGTVGSGISTESGNGATTISTSGAVSGADRGIYAISTTGAISITSTNTVTGNTRYAIYADNNLATVTIGSADAASTATNATVKIDSSTVNTGASSGIVAKNEDNGGNNGAVTVVTKGAVTYTTGTAIDVSNADDAITIGTTSSKIATAVNGRWGIVAKNTGANGTISITTAAGGTVTGSRSQGILTQAEGGTTNIIVGAAVTGAGNGTNSSEGIKSTSTTGAISIASTSTVTGNNNYAIYAANNLATVTIGSDSVTSTATNATVKINSATGIVAKNGGNGGNNGAVTVQTAGAVTSSGIGIDAGNAGDAIYIGTSDAKIIKAISGTVGIIASNTGTGTISIATGSGGTVTGTSGAGISTSSVNGATTIDVGANVTGATTGIETDSGGGQSAATTSITIRSGATVTGSTRAIDAKTGNGNVTINNAGTVNGSIKSTRYSTGTGTFTFNNAGTFSLAAEQSNSGFTINNQSGGVLKGLGSFGVVNAASGSTILAGDRAIAITSGTSTQRTFNASSLTLAAGAIVDVRADYSGVSDKVAVTGAAALGGATLKITATPKVDATWSAGKSFTILTALNVTGTFGTTQLDYAFLKATLTYTATDVSMTLDRNWTSFGTYATSSNQKSVSDVFDKFQSQTTNPVINRVTTLTVSQAPVALSQLSGTGVVATRTQSFAAGSVFSGAINSEMGKFTSSAGGGSSVMSYAEDTKIKSKAFDTIAPKPEPIPDGRVWAQVLGGIGNMKSDATNPSQRASNYGLAAGADTAINANLRAGFALSLGQSTTKVSSLATSTESTWGQGALYAVATDGDTYLKGALTYGYLDNKTDRSVTAFGTTEKAKGKFGANLYSVRLEAGQKFAFAPVNLTPFFAFEPSWLVQNAYNETGPASITLGFGKNTSRALPATLGGRIDASYDLGDYRMTPSASLGWVHDFANSGSISPFFTSLPGSNFTAQGSRSDRNLARAELNIEASPKDTWATIYLNARADVGSRTNVVRGVAGVSLRF